MNKPSVSVVMSVFNSAPTLSATLDSILKQDGIDFEFVVIDDGSTDNSRQILLDYASQDPRLIVMHQENRGLTGALIRGCAISRGEFIARQDAGGDISLRGRFDHQVAFLRARPTVVMTACGTRVVGPDAEPLYEICQSGRELQEGLRATSIDRIYGPSHHGAVMFRKSAYECVGGYRCDFGVAQDLDLWTRLAEVGDCLATSDVLYETRVSYGSITHLNLEQQKRARSVIVRCAEARRMGRNEAEILEDAKAIQGPPRGWLSDRIRDAGLWYFIGSVLRTKEPRRAYQYFGRALASWPFYLRTWVGLLRLLVRV